MADQIYTVEVRKTFRISGDDVLRWVERPVSEVIPEKGSALYRCKDCHGKVKLFDKHVPHAAAPHAEHVSKQDSEYCPAGMYFRQNPGREPRLSLSPIE
ncbi:MAG TPA: hypothetical protein VHW45_14970 [Candidatus Sulfotelmatobacter sp.]|jgi:hypothetical protein|nr:hypothetical protein [Candidatus Sulfotelmatobacter sp.]